MGRELGEGRRKRDGRRRMTRCLRCEDRGRAKGTKAKAEERRRDKQKVVFWSEWEGGTEGRKKVERGGGEVSDRERDGVKTEVRRRGGAINHRRSEK